jgi:hypothetical protein
VVTICTISLTFRNSTFCPHSVFMCFVWVWEQTAIISLYNINWLVFITETQRVYCAVRVESLYIIQTISRVSKDSTLSSYTWNYWKPLCIFVLYLSLLLTLSCSLSLRPKTHYLHVTWAHVMLRVQLGYLTLNSGAHSHFCHSAYVTWSDVDFWSAHMPARFLNFCWHIHFVRRDFFMSHKSVRQQKFKRRAVMRLGQKSTSDHVT